MVAAVFDFKDRGSGIRLPAGLRQRSGATTGLGSGKLISVELSARRGRDCVHEETPLVNNDIGLIS